MACQLLYGPQGRRSGLRGPPAWVPEKRGTHCDYSGMSPAGGGLLRSSVMARAIRLASNLRSCSTAFAVAGG